MNLLNEALPALQGLIQNQNIEIINKEIQNVNGFPQEIESEVKTFAHIQPINPNELVKLTGGTLDSNKYFRFYCLGNLAQVLSSVSKTDSLILWNESYFRVFSKEDWSLNGWIMVIASEIAKGVETNNERALNVFN